MNILSNTPLRNPPPDYCPEDSERWFKIPEGLDAGKQMFYSDIAPADGEAPRHTVLFVHGNPESSYTYRHIRDSLMAAEAPLRIVAPDHIGMGLSDQADFEMVDMHHAANLLQLVRHLDLKNIILVVHDWGGPIGIGALLEEQQRVDGLLLMNTTVFPMPSDGYTYENFPFPWLPWSFTPKLIPDALWGGVAAAVVCHAKPQNTAEFLWLSAKWMSRFAARSIPQEQPEYVFSEMLRSASNVRSSKRNVKQTPVWGYGYRYTDERHGVQDNRVFYAEMQNKLNQCWGEQGRKIPVCGYFGQWDACGKESVIDQWHEALAQMRDSTYRFADLGHFIEEYKGPEMADSILSMLNSL